MVNDNSDIIFDIIGSIRPNNSRKKKDERMRYNVSKVVTNGVYFGKIPRYSGISMKVNTKSYINKIIYLQHISNNFSIPVVSRMIYMTKPWAIEQIYKSVEKDTVIIYKSNISSGIVNIAEGYTSVDSLDHNTDHCAIVHDSPIKDNTSVTVNNDDIKQIYTLINDSIMHTNIDNILPSTILDVSDILHAEEEYNDRLSVKALMEEMIFADESFDIKATANVLLSMENKDRRRKIAKIVSDNHLAIHQLIMLVSKSNIWNSEVGTGKTRTAFSKWELLGYPRAVFVTTSRLIGEIRTDEKIMDRYKDRIMFGVGNKKHKIINEWMNRNDRMLVTDMRTFNSIITDHKKKISIKLVIIDEVDNFAKPKYSTTNWLLDVQHDARIKDTILMSGTVTGEIQWYDYALKKKYNDIYMLNMIMRSNGGMEIDTIRREIRVNGITPSKTITTSKANDDIVLAKMIAVIESEIAYSVHTHVPNTIINYTDDGNATQIVCSVKYGFGIFGLSKDEFLDRSYNMKYACMKNGRLFANSQILNMNGSLSFNIFNMQSYNSNNINTIGNRYDRSSIRILMRQLVKPGIMSINPITLFMRTNRKVRVGITHSIVKTTYGTIPVVSDNEHNDEMTHGIVSRVMTDENNTVRNCITITRDHTKYVNKFTKRARRIYVNIDDRLDLIGDITMYMLDSVLAKGDENDSGNYTNAYNSCDYNILSSKIIRGGTGSTISVSPYYSSELNYGIIAILAKENDIHIMISEEIPNKLHDHEVVTNAHEMIALNRSDIVAIAKINSKDNDNKMKYIETLINHLLHALRKHNTYNKVNVIVKMPRKTTKIDVDIDHNRDTNIRISKIESNVNKYNNKIKDRYRMKILNRMNIYNEIIDMIDNKGYSAMWFTIGAYGEIFDSVKLSNKNNMKPALVITRKDMNIRKITRYYDEYIVKHKIGKVLTSKSKYPILIFTYSTSAAEHLKSVIDDVFDNKLNTKVVAANSKVGTERSEMSSKNMIYITSYNIMSRGFNFDDIQTVILYDPAQKKEHIEQAIGRIERPNSNDNTEAYILVHKYIELSEDAASLDYTDTDLMLDATLIRTFRTMDLRVARSKDVESDEYKHVFNRLLKMMANAAVVTIKSYMS